MKGVAKRDAEWGIAPILRAFGTDSTWLPWEPVAEVSVKEATSGAALLCL